MVNYGLGQFAAELFEQFLLRAREFARHFDDHFHMQIALAVAARRLQAFLAQAEQFSRLGRGRHVAFENVVFAHVDHHVQVAGAAALPTGLALAARVQAHAGFDAGGDLEFDGLLLFGPAFTAAGGARILEHVAAAAAA